MSQCRVRILFMNSIKSINLDSKFEFIVRNLSNMYKLINVEPNNLIIARLYV